MTEPARRRVTRARASTVVTVVAALAGIGAFAWFRIWQARAGDPLIW